MRTEIADLNERVKNLEQDKASKDDEIANLKENIAKAKADTDRETRRKERLEKELKEVKGLLMSQNTFKNSSSKPTTTRKKRQSTH